MADKWNKICFKNIYYVFQLLDICISFFAPYLNWMRYESGKERTSGFSCVTIRLNNLWRIILIFRHDVVLCSQTKQHLSNIPLIGSFLYKNEAVHSENISPHCATTYCQSLLCNRWRTLHLPWIGFMINIGLWME